MTPISESSMFTEIGDDLRRVVDAALPSLRAISLDDAGVPVATGKWSSKEIVGHLIDSASNNHQRFVRAQEAAALVFPPYAQDHWVSVQRYHERSWTELVSLWHAYNHHLAHVIRCIPEARRATSITIGAYAPITLSFLAFDYVDHLEKHLKQIAARQR